MRYYSPVGYILSGFLAAVLLVSVTRATFSREYQTSQPAAQQLTPDEQKVVKYVLNMFATSNAGKPNLGPEAAAAVQRDLGITVTPEMVPRIRQAVVDELKKLEAAKALVEGESVAPGFTAPAIGDKTIKLSDYKGKVVVLNFWATWCPPCLQEMPVLNEISSAYKSKGVEVIGMSLDEEGLNITRPFLKKLGIAYTIALSDKETYQAYGNILTIPHTFVIDRNGVVQKRLVGKQAKEVFEEAIKSVL